MASEARPDLADRRALNLGSGRQPKADAINLDVTAVTIVWRLANRFPRAYEQRWTWIFPAWFLAIQLEVVKEPPPVRVSSSRV